MKQLEVAQLVAQIEDLRDELTEDNREEIVQQARGIVEPEWIRRLPLAPMMYVPLPQLAQLGEAPWLSVVWVIGCPHPFDVGDTVDRRILDVVGLSLAHVSDGVNVPIMLRQFLTFVDYTDADAYSRTMSLGACSTRHFDKLRDTDATEGSCCGK